MSNRRSSTDSTVRKTGTRRSASKYSGEVQVRAEAGKFCVYNQSRERFLGSDVDAADSSVASPGDRMPTLAAESGAGLWMVPFKGVSPASVRVPLDLIYLDENQIVIGTVESFPISRISPSVPTPASVLALPAHTIDSTETRPGDQLILCPPDEMKRRLEQPPAPVSDPVIKIELEEQDESISAGAGRVLPWKEHSRLEVVHEELPANSADETQIPPAELPAPAPTIVDLPVQAESIGPSPVESIKASQLESIKPSPVESIKPVLDEPIEPTAGTVSKAKSWFKRTFWPDVRPTEPRKASRESISGLAAYFWTGGVPKQHDIRDISPTGLYVITEERWFPGTVVRMTLTDCREANSKRSITVNTMAVRWGNDGVGLQFVVQDQRRGQAPVDQLVGAIDQKDVDQFLQLFKEGKA